MKTFTTIIAAVMMMAASQNPIHAQHLLWAHNPICSSNVGNCEGLNVASDAAGNVYLTGYFSNTIVFGVDTLYAYGTSAFLAKYNAAGVPLWARGSNEISTAIAYGVTTDANNNVFITGLFSSAQVAFGADTLTRIGNNGTYSTFTVKYDSSGNVLWAKSGGGAQHCVGYAASADPFGNCFVTGYFYQDPVTFGSNTISTAGAEDVFLVKYDPLGNVVWLRDAGGSHADYGYSVKADANGNVYLGGIFDYPSANFGNITLTTSNQSGSPFLAKYDSSGNAIWAKDGIGSGAVNGIATDPSGNAIVTGWFGSDSLILGSHLLINTLPGYVEFFIAKYDTSGNVLWAKSSNGETKGYNIMCDANGNAYASTGGFNNTIPVSFDNVTLVPSLTSNGPSYIIKYDSSGNAVCGLVFEAGGQTSLNNGIASGPQNTIYFGGSYAVSPFVIFNDSLPLVNTETPFVLRVSLGSIVTSAFTLDTTQGCKPLAVQFINHSSNATSYYWSFGNNFTSNAVNPTHLFSATGTYTITLIAYDSSGCGISSDTSYLTTFITVFPPPVQPIITQSGDTLISSYTNGNQWYVDTTAIAGAVNQRYVVTVSGCYYIIETDSNGCKGESDSLCLIYTGMNKLTTNDKLTIFPNPATNEVTISIADENIKNYTINLYDVIGEKVMQEQITNNKQYSLDICHIPQGIYFLEVLMDGENVIRKVVKL
jgi:PKD repeat protein